MKRFRVDEMSMHPALRPGQEVVATDASSPSPGDIVVFEHPGRTGFWMIKRLIDDEGWVLSDNQDVATSDSRSLGSIDIGGMMRVVDQLDALTFPEACRLLADEEPCFARIIDRWELPDFWHRPPGFETLSLLILEQQVSLESGAAMYRRLAELLGEVSPVTVGEAGEETLRSLGVTRQKAGYLLALATHVLEGRLDLDRLSRLETPQARTDLMSVKGIGAWTADAYLLSALRKPDIWPVGDRALQVGCGEVLGLSAPANESELAVLGEPWRPIRAAAARLIWHSYLCERGRAEPEWPASTHGADPNA